jgi:hypothetical protein
VTRLSGGFAATEPDVRSDDRVRDAFTCDRPLERRRAAFPATRTLAAAGRLGRTSEARWRRGGVPEKRPALVEIVRTLCNKRSEISVFHPRMRC